MSKDGDENVFDKVHHLKHAMNKNGASALIKHLDGLKIAAKFDFICLEFVRMPTAYYTNFVTGESQYNPGLPFVEFLCRLRDCNKLKSGCKCLFASVEQKSNRWLETIQLLEKYFGCARDVEATENPFYRACAAAARSSDGYDYVTQLGLKNKYEKPFAEYTVLPVSKDNELSSPFNVTNPLSEDHDEERDSELALDTMLRDMGSGSPLNVTNPLSSKSKHDLVKQLEKVTSQLEYLTDQYRVLQEKLNKCECEVHEKGRLFIYN